MTVSHVEVLVEEPSAEAALQILLPKMLGDASFAVYAHSCKDDLLKRLPERLRGYASWLPDDWRIVVVVDRDHDDCAKLKKRLERLRRVLAVVRKADRGLAAKNRAMLFQDREGVVPFDLLARGEYETFLAMVGIGEGRREMKLTPLSPEALEARRPRPPEERVGALQDRVHVEKGKLLSATPIRRKRQE